MTETELKQVADGADVIIDGYAFTQRAEGDFCVLNLNNPSHAAVFDGACHMTETSMDDTELAIAWDYLDRAVRYLKLAHA